MPMNPDLARTLGLVGWAAAVSLVSLGFVFALTELKPHASQAPGAGGSSGAVPLRIIPEAPCEPVGTGSRDCRREPVNVIL